jgi:hypothetical protein
MDARQNHSVDSSMMPTASRPADLTRPPGHALSGKYAQSNAEELIFKTATSDSGRRNASIQETVASTENLIKLRQVASMASR